ncbi:MAG: substrate-binding domain-containing protein [Oscillospiraceae bacterium]
MKKLFAVLTGTALLAAALTGCGSAGKPAGFDPAKDIGVVSREDGSGTRGAFIELFGVQQKNEAGEKIDRTTANAAVTDSTSVMMTTVSGDLYAIGYISLGSLNDTVRAVEIDGAAPSVASIENGSYKIARPFNLVAREALSENASDFMDFILSADGQSVVEANGYIALKNAPAYSGGMSEGKTVVSGSSSVTPVMEKLKEAYIAKNPGVTVEIQQSDSSTGIQNAAEGVCDLGMASRELKDSEIALGLAATVIATDGIAVIVNNESTVTALTSEQVMRIFTGDAVVWSDVIG